MALADEIKTKREAAAAALEKARELGRQLKDKPDLKESFQRAHAEAMGFVQEFQALERQQELERAHEHLNKPVTRIPTRGGGPDGLPRTEEFKAAHRESLVAYIRHGEQAAREMLETASIGPKEIHALLSTQGDLGGFLSPDDFRAEVERDMGEVAVAMANVRVIPTSRSTLVLPSIASGTRPFPTGFKGAFKAEGATTGGTAPPTQNQPTFGQERIPVHIWQPDAIEVTTELLEDSAAPLDSILAEIIAETLGLDVDQKVVTGTGVGEPEGVLNAGVTEVNSGAAANVTYGGLVNLFTALPAVYRQNGKWMLNSNTFGEILKLESSGGFPLFPPNSLPGTLFTKPILFNEHMADATTGGNKPIIWGDWKKYVIAQRRELRLQRLVERFAPNIAILPTSRLGGQVTRTQGFRIQNVSA